MKSALYEFYLLTFTVKLLNVHKYKEKWGLIRAMFFKASAIEVINYAFDGFETFIVKQHNLDINTKYYH